MTEEKNIITERYSTEQEGAVLVTERRNEEKPRSAHGSVKSGKTAGKAKKAQEKSAAKKTKNAAKNPNSEQPKKLEEPQEQSISVKTPSVMKLVEDDPLAENQVIAAGKSRIPRQLRGIEPLSRVIRREAEAERRVEEQQNSPIVTKELTGMVIEAAAPEVLARFNACDCGICRAELSRLAGAEIPARYIRIPESADINWTGFTEDEKLLLASLKKTVMSVMIRLMMANKKRNFHD